MCFRYIVNNGRMEKSWSLARKTKLKAKITGNIGIFLVCSFLSAIFGTGVIVGKVVSLDRL